MRILEGSGWHFEYGEIRDLAFYNKLFALVELGWVEDVGAGFKLWYIDAQETQGFVFLYGFHLTALHIQNNKGARFLRRDEFYRQFIIDRVGLFCFTKQSLL